MGQSKKMFEEQRELEMNELLFHSLPVTKKVIADKAELAVTHVLETGNPIEVAEMIGAMDQFLKQVKSDQKFVNYVREELDKTKGKFTTANGTKIECAENGVKYHYDMCNDPIMKSLLEKQEEVESAVNFRAEFLKRLPPEGTEILHGDELIKIYPPYKTSTSSFKITLSSK